MFFIGGGREYNSQFWDVIHVDVKMVETVTEVHLEKLDGPKAGLASRISQKILSRVWPNCIYSIAVSGKVSWFTPNQE